MIIVYQNCLQSCRKDYRGDDQGLQAAYQPTQGPDSLCNSQRTQNSCQKGREIASISVLAVEAYSNFATYSYYLRYFPWYSRVHHSSKMLPVQFLLIALSYAFLCLAQRCDTGPCANGCCNSNGWCGFGPNCESFGVQWCGSLELTLQSVVILACQTVIESLNATPGLEQSGQSAINVL